MWKPWDWYRSWCLTALLMVLIGILWIDPVWAQSMSDVFTPINTGATQLASGLQTVVQAVAVVIFLAFFAWALVTGRWDFTQLAGMAFAVVGFAAASKVVTALMSVGSN